MLDNMSVAHGRQPYQGERQVLVAMSEPHHTKSTSQSTVLAEMETRGKGDGKIV